MAVQEPKERNRPDCWKCAYFKISWDPSKPYACQMMGFKSRMIPSFEVWLADGSDCRGFAPKQDKHTAAGSDVSVPVMAKKITPPARRVASTKVWEA